MVICREARAVACATSERLRKQSATMKNERALYDHVARVASADHNGEDEGSIAEGSTRGSSPVAQPVPELEDDAEDEAEDEADGPRR